MAHQKCSNSLCLILRILGLLVTFVPPSNMIDPLQVLCSLCPTCSQSWKSWVGIFLHWVKLTCTDDPISGQPRLSPNRNMSHSTTSPPPPTLACWLLVAAACIHSGKRKALTNAIRYNFNQLQEQPKILVPQQSLCCNQLQSLKTAITEKEQSPKSLLLPLLDYLLTDSVTQPRKNVLTSWTIELHHSLLCKIIYCAGFLWTWGPLPLHAAIGRLWLIVLCTLTLFRAGWITKTIIRRIPPPKKYKGIIPIPYFDKHAQKTSISKNTVVLQAVNWMHLKWEASKQRQQTHLNLWLTLDIVHSVAHPWTTVLICSRNSAKWH